jgi:hypothetical protein
MTYLNSLNAMSHHNMEADPTPEIFGHPDDVLNDARLTTDEKRALLASWASASNAVPHVPSMRQLPSGSIVKVDDILRCLKALDARSEPPQGTSALLWQRPFKRRRGINLRRWGRNRHGPDDDDDPPPCPAYAARQPKSGGGADLVGPVLVLA